MNRATLWNVVYGGQAPEWFLKGYPNREAYEAAKAARHDARSRPSGR